VLLETAEGLELLHLLGARLGTVEGVALGAADGSELWLGSSEGTREGETGSGIARATEQSVSLPAFRAFITVGRHISPKINQYEEKQPSVAPSYAPTMLEPSVKLNLPGRPPTGDFVRPSENSAESYSVKL
jgi:hypothetical protein